MADEFQLSIISQGAEVWNSWREQHRQDRIDLSQASLQVRDLVQVNLSRAQLAGTRFNGAVLAQANLSDSDLSGANLSGTDLTRANMRGAILRSSAMFRTDLTAANMNDAQLALAFLVMADLTMASLERADLTGARLTNANFSHAKLKGAILSDAVVESTIFADIDLSGVIGLHKVRHNGPSSIGVDTVDRSAGAIPSEFLRGAGVGDSLIEYSHSLAGADTQVSSCFISYSTKDEPFAQLLYSDLQKRGVRCWFAPHNIQGGRKIHEQIDQAIESHDRLLLVLSDSSMESEWVGSEILAARKRELRENRQILFPISLIPFEQIKAWRAFDADIGRDIAKEIREYYIPDFSKWRETGAYQDALSRLVRDLNAAGRSRQ